MMHSLPPVSHIYIWRATTTQRLVYLDKTRSDCQSDLSVSATPLQRDAKYDKLFLKTSSTNIPDFTHSVTHTNTSPPLSFSSNLSRSLWDIKGTDGKTEGRDQEDSGSLSGPLHTFDEIKSRVKGETVCKRERLWLESWILTLALSARETII